MTTETGHQYVFLSFFLFLLAFETSRLSNLYTPYSSSSSRFWFHITHLHPTLNCWPPLNLYALTPTHPVPRFRVTGPQLAFSVLHHPPVPDFKLLAPLNLYVLTSTHPVPRFQARGPQLPFSVPHHPPVPRFRTAGPPQPLRAHFNSPTPFSSHVFGSTSPTCTGF